MANRGRPNKVGQEHRHMLRAIVEERPSATLAQIGAELKRRASIDAHEATVRKAFVAAGLRRVRGEEEVRRVARAVPNRYG